METMQPHNKQFDGLALQAIYSIVTKAEDSIYEIIGNRVKLIPHVETKINDDKVNIIKKDLQLRQIICTVTGFKWEKIISKSRKRELVNARFMYAFFAKKMLSGVTLKTIGQTIGGRDHTTAIHAIQTVNDMVDTNDAVTLDLIEKITSKILENENKA